MQIPSVGNVAVPDDQYDQFFALVSANPPSYPAACNLLARAAAADTVAEAKPE